MAELEKLVEDAQKESIEDIKDDEVVVDEPKLDEVVDIEPEIVEHATEKVDGADATQDQQVLVETATPEFVGGVDATPDIKEFAEVEEKVDAKQEAAAFETIEKNGVESASQRARWANGTF